MTYEEALEIYKLGNYGSELSKAEADYWLANIDTATELAFKCLEKQIPQRVEYVKGAGIMFCPNCNSCLTGYKYCGECGQAVDIDNWREKQ